MNGIDAPRAPTGSRRPNFIFAALLWVVWGVGYLLTAITMPFDWLRSWGVDLRVWAARRLEVR